MTLDYTGTNNGLFRHIGKLIKHFDLIVSDATDATYGLDADRRDIIDAFQLGTVGNPDLAIEGLPTVVERWKFEDVNRRGSLAAYVLARLRDRATVLDEIGAASSDQTELLRKLFDRMVIDSESVMASVVTLGSVTAGAGNVGDGIIVVTDVLDGFSSPGSRFGQANVSHDGYKGLTTQLCVPSETMHLQVVSDPFQGADAAVLQWSGRCPDPMGQFGLSTEGSGIIGSVGEVHGATSAYLSNADFEEFSTTDTPDNWDIDDGTVGTHINENAANVAHGLKALQFVGDGSQTAVQISQPVGATAVDPNRAYVVSAQVKADSSISAGTLTIQFEGTGYTAGGSEKISIAPGSLPTSFSVKHFLVILPAVIPPDFRLVIKWTGTPDSGKNLYIDDIGLAPVIYGGGVGVAAIRGLVGFGRGDSYKFTITNDEGVIQRAFRQMFGFQLPNDASPTIPDTLVVNPLSDVAAYWKFESDGADSIGSLTLSAVGTITFSAGKRNNSARNTSFSALARLEIVPASMGILQSAGAAFSFSVWRLFDRLLLINPANPASPPLAFLGNEITTSGDYGWAFWLDYHHGNYAKLKGLTRATDDTVDTIEASGLSYGDAAWHHYVITRAAGANARLRIYYDGVLQSEVTSTGVKTVSSPFAIGSVFFIAGHVSTQPQVKGGFDEAAYWTRELTPEDVAALAANLFLP